MPEKYAERTAPSPIRDARMIGHLADVAGQPEMVFREQGELLGIRSGQTTSDDRQSILIAARPGAAQRAGMAQP